MKISPHATGKNIKNMFTPNFSFEKRLWRKGFRVIAGVDEVGRGSFAGPVVAGCVSFLKDIKIPVKITINDSKKLKPRQREKAEKWIKENTLWGTGEVSASVINRVGMAKATQMAFRKAVANAAKGNKNSIDFLLIDAFFVPYVRGLPMARKAARKRRVVDAKSRQQAIVNGDEKSLSIAAASIIAKVERDRIMRSIGRKPRYKRYRWGKNKGYGTKEHQKAIKKYGVTRYHRKSFVASYLTS